DFANSGQVLVFVERRAVHEIEAVQRQRASRKMADPIDFIETQLVLSPEGGGSRGGIEPLQVLQSGGRLVVIAADNPLSVGAHPFGGELRIGAVADDVAEAGDLVV